jgi:hypothetical protein
VQKLAKHVEKIRFFPLQPKDILIYIQTILKKQSIKGLSNSELVDIIESNNGDLRKTINQLQYICVKSSSTKRQKINEDKNNVDENDTSTVIHLDTIFNNVKTLINSRDMSIDNVLQYYHDDSMFIPLFIHENYPSCTSAQIWDLSTTQKLSDISESISMSDSISTHIFSNQLFDLEPLHGIYSTYIPVRNMKLHIERVAFPQFLGKLSSYNNRLSSINTLNDKMTKSMGTMERPVSLDRIQYFKNIIQELLLQGNVKCVIQLLLIYRLTNDDFKDLFILTKNEISFKNIDKKTKALITKGLK